MWTIHRYALAVTLAALAVPAHAEDSYILNQNQTGLALPGVSLPQGYDEVRAADGTSCHSSNTGDGAYADVGVIGGGQGNSNTIGTGAVYGRIVMPLGSRGTRLDCRHLYDLELQRLQTEVRLLKAGLTSGDVATTGSVTKDNPAFRDGWSQDGGNADQPKAQAGIQVKPQASAQASPARTAGLPKQRPVGQKVRLARSTMPKTLVDQLRAALP